MKQKETDRSETVDKISPKNLDITLETVNKNFSVALQDAKKLNPNLLINSEELDENVIWPNRIQKKRFDSHK